MIKKLLRLQIFLLFFPIILVAQKDSIDIRKEIVESEESEQMLIQKSRNFIYNKLKAGNINDARDAFDYTINQYEKESIRPFWIVEKSLLGYWFGKYEILYVADSIDNFVAHEGQNTFTRKRINLLWNYQTLRTITAYN